MPTQVDNRPIVLLNAAHAIAGGGLIYLEHILAELATSTAFRWILCAPRETLQRLDVPPGWVTWTSPTLRFWAVHPWEQLILPLRAWKSGVSITLCNVNYVPLLAPNPHS